MTVLDRLFSPFTLKSLRLQNRFVLAAMSRYNSWNGVPSEEFTGYHRRRAAAGVGLTVTGATAVDRPAANNHPNLANFRDDSYAAWQRVVDEVHALGGPIGLQLWHAGALFNVAPEWRPEPIESPSGLMAPDKPIGVAMSEEMIADTIAAFAKGAARAQAMGFDAVEIHACHGFLIDQFFWDATNRRSDRWGGRSLVERSRFAVEVLRGVRAAIGPDLPLLVRLSQWKEQDYSAKLARSPEELRVWLETLAGAGVDCFDCSQRRFWEAEFDGSDLNFAGWVKKLTGLPVITAGSVGLNTDVMSFIEGKAAEPAPIDELLRRFDRGDFDLVAVGRALLADPDWLVKIREGRLDKLQTIYPSPSLATQV
jgi:2,4-dienoyl-CoA reductase-like NADH-dependent reductase (Old Yellow Enzyme family)